jgi:hypothetical protein
MLCLVRSSSELLFSRRHLMNTEIAKYVWEFDNMLDDVILYATSQAYDDSPPFYFKYGYPLAMYQPEMRDVSLSAGFETNTPVEQSVAMYVTMTALAIKEEIGLFKRLFSTEARRQFAAHMWAKRYVRPISQEITIETARVYFEAWNRIFNTERGKM